MTGATPAVDLTARVGSVTLPNPVMTAAGTSGHGAELRRYFDLSRLGAVVVKSLSFEPWAGNPPPRVCETDSGMLNSVGLQNPGVEAWIEHDLPALVAAGARVVASIWGFTIADYEKVAAALAEVRRDVVAVEVNLSCPNVETGREMFAHSPSATAEAIAATAACRRPRWAKLSPNVTDVVEIGRAALGAGAEALTLVNTLMAMAIDPRTRRPRTGTGGGGLSGAALRPLAVRAVYECAQAFPEAALVGVGGVSTGEHAAELVLAGASAVQVGTATFANPCAPVEVLDGLATWARGQRAARVSDLVGSVRGTA